MLLAPTFISLIFHIGTGIRISTEVVRTALGSSALEPGNDFKLTAWLGSQEDQHQVVVYQAGGGQSTLPPPPPSTHPHRPQLPQHDGVHSVRPKLKPTEIGFFVFDCIKPSTMKISIKLYKSLIVVKNFFCKLKNSFFTALCVR